MKLILISILILVITSCNCNCHTFKYKKGDIVEQKIVRGLLVVKDTLTLYGEPSYKLIDGKGSNRVIEEYKLELIK